jgi:predicted DNA-binding transcriptional regulator AlpA
MERVLEEAKLAVLQLPKSFRVGSCVRFCPAAIARWLRERGG